MEVIINYWVVVGGAIFLFVMGMLWYGPLFGKVWMKIMGVENMSKEDIAKAQKEMLPMYIIQVLLGLVTSYVLYHFVNTLGMTASFWIWLGFSMPLAAGSMWDTKDGYKMKKFLITAGYQLVTLLTLGWVFANMVG